MPTDLPPPPRLATGLVVLRGDGLTFNDAWVDRCRPRLSKPVTQAADDTVQPMEGKPGAHVTRAKPRLRLTGCDERCATSPIPPRSIHYAPAEILRASDRKMRSDLRTTPMRKQ